MVSLLGEGSVSLKDLITLPSHWSDHQSCNNPCVDLQSSLSFSSWGTAFFSSCWSMNLICDAHTLKICRRGMNMTYCDLGIDKLKSFYVGMICNVIGEVCHSEICGCVLIGLSKIIVSCFCGGCIYPSVVI